MLAEVWPPKMQMQKREMAMADDRYTKQRRHPDKGNALEGPNGGYLSCAKCGSFNLAQKGVATIDGTRRYSCREPTCLKHHGKRQPPIEIMPEDVIEGIRNKRQIQRLQDQQRVERKKGRELNRIDNLLETLNNELLRVFKGHNLSKLTKKHRTKKTAPRGILHLSDLHFNELVEMPNNQYDFHVASQRLYKYVQKAKAHFHSLGVRQVLIAFTGDLMNSDRRLDEIVSAATNRTQATFLAVDILQQLILDVNQDFNVDVAWVCGNEGRANAEPGWVDFVASDNYDHMIMLCLSKIFEGGKVRFIKPANPCESLLHLDGFNLLLLHGHGGAIKKTGVASSTTTIRSKYAEQGEIVDYIIWGHIHEAYISDLFARSGSPVGGNAYSENALSLRGRASQNYYILDDGAIDGVKIDLQNVDGWQGYNFDAALEAYNPRSAEKTRAPQTIFRVVV